MGAQVYEAAIIARAAQVLGPDWRVQEAVVRSMRSGLPGTHRLPLGRVGSAPAVARRWLGRVVFPRDAVVHRMSLELPPSGGRDVITLHDMIAWRYADESAPVKAAAREARRAAAVICGSTYTAQEAVSLLGIADPVVVPYGVEDRFFGATPLDAVELGRLGVRRPFVLASGGASERKNLGALAAAWPNIVRARPDVSLVLSGPEHPRRTALFAGLPQVRLVGRVSDEVVPRPDGGRSGRGGPLPGGGFRPAGP